MEWGVIEVAADGGGAGFAEGYEVCEVVGPDGAEIVGGDGRIGVGVGGPQDEKRRGGGQTDEGKGNPRSGHEAPEGASVA